MRRSVNSPGLSSGPWRASASACSLSGPTRTRTLVHDLDTHLHGVLGGGLHQQPLDGQLEVVEVLVGEVEAVGHAAEHEAYAGMPPARVQRSVSSMDCGSLIGPVPAGSDDAPPDNPVTVHQRGSLTGSDSFCGLLQFELEAGVPAGRPSPTILAARARER